jgi:hypothetical protein
LEPIVIVPDVHRPYHDKTAWALFLRVAKSMRPTHLICIGDFADFYSVSSHSKDPRRALRLSEEIADVRVGLSELDALGATHKKFIGGNHCDRLTRYLADKAPELFGMIDIPDLFQLRARGWDYTPYKQHAELGKANFTHDVGVSGRNASFRALDTFQHTIVTGHAHRFQYIVEGNALGEAKLSAQFGWLGDAEQVDYMHRVNVLTNWALGFGVGYVQPQSGIVYLVPVPIVRVGRDYTCVVNGQLFVQSKVVDKRRSKR